jgi:transposase
LLESYRNTEGQPRQRVVVSLGDAALPEPLRAAVAKAVERRLYPAAQSELFAEELSTAARQWVDQIFQRVAREGRFKPLLSQAPAGGAAAAAETTIDGVNVDGVSHSNSTVLGPLLLVKQAWDQLKLPEQLESLGFNAAQRAAALVSVSNRLVEPASEHALGAWLPTTALPELVGEEILRAGRDQFYRVSDKLLAHQAALTQHLRQAQASHFQLSSTILLYDLTNTHFEGSALANPKAKRGKNKQKRDDCPQVVVGMVFDQDGFALAHKTFAGNQHDAKSLPEMIDELKALSVREGLLVPPQKPLLIVDGGVASKNNLAQLQAAGIQYLVNDSRRRRSVWRVEFAQDESFTLLPGREGRSAVRVKLLELPTQERLVLCKSAGRKDKEDAIRSGAEQHLREALAKLDQRLKTGQLKEPEKIQRVIGRVLGQHPRVQRYYKVSLRDANQPTAGLQWDRNDEQYQAAGDLAGCYVLRTDRAGLTAEEIWRLYVTLTHAEAAFAALKGDLGLRPNYHQLENRVDAHIFITVLAYHLWKFISHTLARSGDHRDWATLRRVLQTHCYATVHVPTRDGITYHLRKPGQAEACQAQIYQLFGIDLASLPRTKVVTQTKIVPQAKVETRTEPPAIL